MNQLTTVRRAWVVWALLALIGLVALGNFGGGASVQAAQATAQPTTNPAATPAATEEATPAATREATVAATAEASVIGTVSGTVTNGTAGGTVPPDLQLELNIIKHTADSADTNRITTPVNPDGTFAFKDVEIRAAYLYGVIARYQNRTFTSEFKPGDPANPTLDLPVKVYDVTSDANVLSINGIFLQIAAAQSGISIAQVVRFGNSSDKVFSTEQKIGDNAFASISLPVPVGAQFSGFPEGEMTYVVSDDRKTVSDITPVLPGTEHFVQMLYEVPYSANGTPVEIVLPYPINGSAQLFVHPPNFTLSGNLGSLPLVAGERQTLDGQPYITFVTNGSQPAGSKLSFTITGDATAASGTQSTTASGGIGISRDLLVGLLIGGGLGLVVVGGMMLMRERARDRAMLAGGPGAQKENKGDSQAQIASLVAELAKLDEQHSAGKVAKADYDRRRSEIKAQLARLMKQ